LQELLKTSAKSNSRPPSAFLFAIAKLADTNLGYKDKCLPDDFPINCLDEGFAFSVNDEAKHRVIVVLRITDLHVPGIDSFRLLLFDAEGRITDYLSCELTNRATVWFGEPGSFRANPADSFEDDGAQLVVRYVPTYPQKGSYDIVFRNKTCRFPYDLG